MWSPDRCELRLADRVGADLGLTAPAVNISWSVELGGKGYISFDVDARSDLVTAHPTLLDNCVIRLAIPLGQGRPPSNVAAYANRARSGVLWSGAGKRVRQVRAAPTLWTAWGPAALLHTEANTIPQMAGEQRYFSAAASIYDPATDPDFIWQTPSDSVGQQDSTSGDRAGKPDSWPTELGNAYWITRPGSATDETRHLFIADVDVPSDCYLTVYASCDENLAVYFAGELVIRTSASETGYEHVDTWSAWVTAGTYRILADKTSIISRGGDGHDPVLIGVATNHDNGSIDDVLLVTNGGDWRVYTMHPVTGVAPSLTPGQIMLELHSQAAARGVDTWAAIMPTFTATHDSDGVPWAHREERTWRVGYDTNLDMIEGLGDLGVDVAITPSLRLQAYAGEGADLSGSVVVEALVNADDITEQGVAPTGTVLYVETQDGWVPDPLVNAAALAEHGRIETSLSLGNAPSTAQGARLGQTVLDERLSKATTDWSIDFYATTGCMPFYDFTLGSIVTIKIGSDSTRRVVTAIGGSAPHVGAITRFTLATAPVPA